jgi:hypothetical protein
MSVQNNHCAWAGARGQALLEMYSPTNQPTQQGIEQTNKQASKRTFTVCTGDVLHPVSKTVAWLN